MDDQTQAAWSEAVIVLSNCLRHPDESVREAVSSPAGLSAAVESIERAGVEPPAAPAIEDRDLTEEYEGLFGAFRTPFAPPAASPYKEWYEGREGLMEGPPATAMERRYAAIGADVPEAYPADHVALELEYASILLDAGEIEELRRFVESELDWIDAFARLVEDAAAEAPFHRWSVKTLVEAMAALRSELDVDGPSEERIDRMVDRARTNVV
ncbi:putative component of anaerobic dehydrogenase [Halanaeroarchaeum sp. HSR-CO]|uniref:TorD/DmsD family molecular chaperone n=1 Tax=Halanaeroarchaeum sp. HSR-CO TaxID=2866382 RepID=UPI00217EE22E|nr:molecular chaperone TorD family protein [Halanaeroarchaeum sp. HSR-CO]UWG47336.1 putative component of anaerobic dehydrogenase [Halanaeroarchaeum sp. HSR-CO]